MYGILSARKFKNPIVTSPILPLRLLVLIFLYCLSQQYASVHVVYRVCQDSFLLLRLFIFHTQWCFMLSTKKAARKKNRKVEKLRLSDCFLLRCISACVEQMASWHDLILIGRRMFARFKMKICLQHKPYDHSNIFECQKWNLSI